jgi:hypothetical protein
MTKYTEDELIEIRMKMEEKLEELFPGKEIIWNPERDKEEQDRIDKLFDEAFPKLH